QVRLVMFDPSNLRRHLPRISIQSLGDLFFDSKELALRPHSPQSHPRDLQGVKNLFIEPGPRVTRDRDVSKLLRLYTRLVETIPDRPRRESGAVLDAIKPFFSRGRH